MSKLTQKINEAYYEALFARMEAEDKKDDVLVEKFESLRKKIGRILLMVENDERQ